MPKPGKDEGGVPGIFTLFVVIAIIMGTYWGCVAVFSPFIERLLQQ